MFQILSFSQSMIENLQNFRIKGNLPCLWHIFPKICWRRSFSGISNHAFRNCIKIVACKENPAMRKDREKERFSCTGNTTLARGTHGQDKLNSFRLLLPQVSRAKVFQFIGYNQDKIALMPDCRFVLFSTYFKIAVIWVISGNFQPLKRK